MRLRIATKNDLDGILKLVSHLHSESIYSKFSTYNPEDVKKVAIKILEGDPRNSTIIVLEDDEQLVGILACSVMPFLFNSKTKVAVELAFWIDPEVRSPSTIRLLLKSYKYWAKVAGCQSIMYGKLTTRDTVEDYIIRKLK